MCFMKYGRDDNLLIALDVESWPVFHSRDGVVQKPIFQNDFKGSTRFVNYETVDEGKRLPELYSSSVDCCGCSACASVCPKGAIAMFPDIEGFLYPVVDAGKCVGCEVCLRVCPLKSI